MEFRFRAGEDRPPSYLPPSIADAYLPPQSPRGISSHPGFTFTMPSSFFPTPSLPQFPPGYFGPNLQTHDPLQNPMMIPVNPMMMMPVRESVRRELEKELIREEIITGEILRKRELEEEVRRELAYEREVALRRQAQQFSLQGIKHNKKAKQEEFLDKPPCGGNKTEAAELMNQNKVKEEWFCDLCNVRATSELDLKNIHLQGKKHKAKAKERELLIASESGGGNNIEAEELVIPKVVKMEWSCDLCHVMAPNEQALTEHLLGKKHKAKEEELLIASKCDEGNKIEAAELINPNKVRNEVAELINPNKVKKEWSCALCQVNPPNEQHLTKHLQGKKHKAKEEKLLIASKCDEGNKIEAAEFINPNKVKNEAAELFNPNKVNKEWSCALCQLSHPSEQHLNKHLQGKKHKAKAEKLLIASKCDEGNKIEAAELINPNKVRNEAAELINPNKVRNEAAELINPNKVTNEAAELINPNKVRNEAAELINPNKVKNEAAELINPNKVKKEWSCALYQVSPPNEQHLNKHLQGNKHKAKEEELLIASKPASSSTTSKKADNSNTLEKQGVTSNEQQKKLQQVPKEAKEIVTLMEFTLRAGEDRPSSYRSPSPAGTDGYFTAQALRGGYLGSDLRTPDPLQNPMMISAREAVLRELEKERIREEIIASEILRKRELEEEVRRELAYEREVGPRMQASEFSLQGRAHKPKEVKKEWSCALCRVSTSSEQALKQHLQDKKHKAKEEELIAAGKRGRRIKKSGASSSAAPKMANKSQFPKQFGGVTTNGQQKKSQQNGEEVKKHPLRGKEDVKQHPLRGKEDVKQHPLRVKEEVKKHPLRCKEDVKRHPLRGREEVKQHPLPCKEDVKQHPLPCKEEVKQHPIRCKHCNVKCYSKGVFVSHLQGKKHLARMQELKASATKGNEESRADMKVKQKRRRKKKAVSTDVVAKAREVLLSKPKEEKEEEEEEEEEEEAEKANNKAGASNKKGPNMKKACKPKVVMKFMTMSHSKGQQKPQVGQSVQQQQVPEKQNGAVKVKKHPVLRKHCKVKLLCVKKYNAEYKV